MAHWDTRPVSDNPAYDGPHTPVPGANDGASGVAVLLGMADVLKRTPPGVGVDLLFVDGEDYGNFKTEKDDVLIGSRYYAQHQPPGSPPLYAILFDLVADKDLKLLPEGQSLLAAPEVVDLVWNVARDIGHGDVFVNAPGQARPSSTITRSFRRSVFARSTWSTMHTLMPRTCTGTPRPTRSTRSAPRRCRWWATWGWRW